MAETLLRARSADVETWTLNRPEVRNALNPQLVAELRGALATATSDGIEIVVIRGAGDSFCAGADLRFLQAHDPGRGQTPVDFLRDIWDLTLAMERSATTFVAALHGHAVAGGLELALACDVVLAAEATLIGDGHVRRNLLPGGGASARLERAIGRGPSAWLALSGSLLPAEDVRFGQWLHDVVPLAEVDERVEEAIVELRRSPTAARAAYKALLNDRVSTFRLTDRERELAAFGRHWLRQDVPAELRKFLDRRTEASR
jgi:enoyl-CoA hydratase